MTSDISAKVVRFFAAFPVQEFSKRQLLIRPEEPLPGIFYIVEGRVSQYDISPSGNEVVVNVFKPGAFFPMSTALNNTPNAYFFEASIHTTVQVAPVEAAVQFLQDNPDVTLDLLKRVYKGVDGVLRRSAHVMGGDAKSRLLFELLNAAYRFGEAQQNGQIIIPLKETDLARHAGMARETVNRTIQHLKTADLITVTPTGIVLKDIHKLETLLGSAL